VGDGNVNNVLMTNWQW